MYTAQNWYHKYKNFWTKESIYKHLKQKDPTEKVKSNINGDWMFVRVVSTCRFVDTNED